MPDQPGSIESNQSLLENIPPRRRDDSRIIAVFRLLEAQGQRESTDRFARAEREMVGGAASAQSLSMIVIRPRAFPIVAPDAL